MKYLTKIKKIVGVVTGLAGLVFTLSGCTKDYKCHEWDFDNSSIKICMYDWNKDGEVDAISTFKYDSEGNETKNAIDDNCDGKDDRIARYKYDSNGNRTETTIDINNYGKFDSTSTYGSKGNLTKTIEKETGYGKANKIRTYKYDSEGNQIECTEDWDNDGKVDATCPLKTGKIWLGELK